MGWEVCVQRRIRALFGGLENIVRSLGATWQWATPLVGPQTVLITGASVGVGLEVARILLAETEHRLVLTARASSMGRFADAGVFEGPRVRLRTLDVRDKAAREALVAEIERDWDGVDVLVNNAGVAYRSVVEHVTEQERLDQMAINFRAPMALTRLVLPSMRRKRRGRILNVSSVGGMTAMPTMAVYSGSKFALEGASEALYYEVRSWGIRVSLIEPGFINSDGFKKVRFTHEGQASLDDPDDPYHRHYVNMESMVERLMTLTWSTPKTVARTIVRTMQRAHPPLRVAGTPDAALFDLGRRLLPRFLYHHLLYAGLPSVWSWGPRRLSADDDPPGSEQVTSKDGTVPLRREASGGR
jgi:short-subunit dehydrogenase